jgi:hypothetical protein
MIKSKEKKSKIEIDLTGPEGNAFSLIGCARKLCRQLEKDFEPIQKEMTSGDYENLVKVFDREFGDWVILYR